MAEFKDSKKRIWSVNIHRSLVTKVREYQDVDLLDLRSDPLVKLRCNPGKLVSVLYILCERQIERLGLSPEEFASCLPMRYEILITAIEQAIIAMFPKDKQSGIREEFALRRKVALKSDQLLLAKLSQLHPDQIGPHKTEDEVRASLEKLLLKEMET